MKGEKKKKRYTCAEYRDEMMLLGLTRRLGEENLTDTERGELLARIRELETAMEMD